MGLEKETQQDRLKEIVKANIAPAMKKAGFKKKGNWFNREGETNTNFLNIVSSRWNTQDEVDFTLEAYVMPNGKKPIQDTPIKRQRIGQIKGERDYWYKITSEVDAEVLGQEIERDVSEYIMPFFDSVTKVSRRQAYDILENLESRGR